MTGTGPLLQELAPRVLSAVTRHHGDFDACEDAVQEALLAAATRWPVDGVPDNPAGWLITVASRRRIELWRADTARRRREDTAFTLTPPSQVALTLRAVGGLTTAEIARASLVPEATVAQRISRAKQRVEAAGARFDLPPHTERDARLDAVRHVLYLVFTEGHTAGSGADLHRVDLSGEAIRLARDLSTRLHDDGESAGLPALMLRTDARRPAHTRPDGSLVPLAGQDRSRRHPDLIAEGTRLVRHALTTTPTDHHPDRPLPAASRHRRPARRSPRRRRQRPEADPRPLRPAALDHPRPDGRAQPHRRRRHGPRTRRRPRPARRRGDRPRAHLLDLAGDHDTARTHYARAARAALSLPERRYLEERAHPG